MNRLLRSATALAVGMPMLMGVAHAADGWYGKVEGNYTYRGTLNFSAPARGGFNSLLGSGARETGNDFSGGGVAAGYSWASGWRVEVEASRHKGKLDPDFEIANGEGEASLLMLNGYMDFNKDSVVQPYVSGGLGYGAFNVKAATNNPTNPSNQIADGYQNNLAYQAQAGIGIRVSENMMLDLGYRHMGTDQLKIRLRSIQPPTAANYKTEVDYHEDSITFGLRMHF